MGKVEWKYFQFPSSEFCSFSPWKHSFDEFLISTTFPCHQGGGRPPCHQGGRSTSVNIYNLPPSIHYSRPTQKLHTKKHPFFTLYHQTWLLLHQLWVHFNPTPWNFIPHRRRLQLCRKGVLKTHWKHKYLSKNILPEIQIRTKGSPSRPS